MKKIYRKLLILLIFPLFFTLFSCSVTGEVSYYTSNVNTSVVHYRLINNNTAYELVNIESNSAGFFVVDISYNDPYNNLGELPVLGIADYAFSDQEDVFVLYIAANIIYFGESIFNNWLEHQTILFQINEMQSTNLFYEFDENWNENCAATINWGVKPEQFGISSSDYQFPDEINELADAKYELINNNTAYRLTGINLNYSGFYNIPRVYKSPLNSYGELPVIAISERAFYNSKAEYICVPDTIRYIGFSAFGGTTENQKVLFEIAESEAYYYNFANAWDYECGANIYWDLGDLFIY